MNNKQYLISFLASIQGDKLVVRGLRKIQTETDKTGKGGDKLGKKTKSLGQQFQKLALRAALTIPVWLLLRSIFMGIITTIRDMIIANLDLEEGLARIKTVVSASSKTVETDMARIKQKILDVAVKTRIPIKDLAEAFYFLRTANLSTQQAIDAFEPVINAMVGTMNNAKDTARAVAGIFNTMGDAIGDNLTDLEKMQKISDLLTFTYACYTPDTEILTDQGWKYFKDLNKTEKVATLNPKTNEIEYQKPREYVVKWFDGKLCHLKGKFADIKVTPKHKLYTKVGYRPKNQNYVLAEAGKVFGRPKSFYRGSNWLGDNPEYFILPEIENKTGNRKAKKIPMKLWVQFLGWYLSEGCCTWIEGDDPTYKITIYQSKKSKYWDDLKLIMKKMPYTVSEFHRGFNIHNKQLCQYLKQFGKSYEKFIPNGIKNLSKDLLRAFLQTYAFGDSSFKKKGFVIITSSKKMRDDLQEIALKANYGTTYLTRPATSKKIKGIKTNTRENWMIGFSNRTEFLMYNKKNKYYAKLENRKTASVEEWVDYKGLVYCVEVPKYHTLFVRRNGKTLWCGNTQDVQLQELTESYTKFAPYVSGLSDDFTEIITTLGFLNTRLLRGGRTGRLTGRAILQLTKNSSKLADVFGITFDPNKPIKFLEIIEQISKQIKTQGAITAQQGQKIQDVFATRAGVAVRLLIDNFDELKRQVQRANEEAEGFAKRMKAIREETTRAQLGRLKNLLAIVAHEYLNNALAGMTLAQAIKGINDNLEASRDQFRQAGSEVGFYTANMRLLVQTIAKLRDNTSEANIVLGSMDEAMGKSVGFDIRTFGVAGAHISSGIRMFKIALDALIESTGISREEQQKKHEEFQRQINSDKRTLMNFTVKQKADVQATEVRRDTHKEIQQIIKHQVNLMKIVGASELEIAKFKEEALDLELGNLDIKEEILRVQKENNNLIEKELQSRRTIKDQILNAQITILKTLGASESDIIDMKKRELDLMREVIGEEQYRLQLKNLELQKVVAITKEKRKEWDAVTGLFGQYAKADELERGRIKRAIELTQLKPKQIAWKYRTNIFDREIIDDFFSHFNSQSKDAVNKTRNDIFKLGVDFPKPRLKLTVEEQMKFDANQFWNPWEKRGFEAIENLKEKFLELQKSVLELSQQELMTGISGKIKNIGRLQAEADIQMGMARETRDVKLYRRADVQAPKEIHNHIDMGDFQVYIKGEMTPERWDELFKQRSDQLKKDTLDHIKKNPKEL